MKVRVLTEPEVETASVQVSELNADNSKAKEYQLSRVPDVVSLSTKVDSFAFGVESAGYKTTIVTRSRKEIEALPVSGGVREVKLQLEKDYKDQIRLYVIYDPKIGEFVAVPQPVRSYEKVIEESGIAPGIVFDDLLPDGGIQGLALSPDGQSLVFAEARPKLVKPVESSSESKSGTRRKPVTKLIPLEACNLKMIKLVDPSGNRISGGIEHLTREAFRDVDPTFTPDGQFIRFASNRRRPQNADILQIKATAKEGGVQNIYVDSGNNTALRPSMARDGTTVFALQAPGEGGLAAGNIHIWVTGGPEHPFDTEIAAGTEPQISPDGKRIAYIAADKNLYVIKIDGSSSTQTTFGAAKIERTYRAKLFEEIETRYGDALLEQVEKRYGEKVAEQIKEDHGGKLAEAEPRELLDGWLEDEFNFKSERFLPYSTPSWSPDGKHILFTSMEGNDPTGRPNEDIWMITAEGSRPVQLTTNGSADTNPLVSPDGQYIYFLSNRGQRWAICSMKARPELAMHP
jgi:hypothetical protein